MTFHQVTTQQDYTSDHVHAHMHSQHGCHALVEFTDLTAQNTSAEEHQNLPDQQEQQSHIQDLMARQLELEKEMADRGRERYFHHIAKLQDAGKESQTSYGVLLMKRGIEPIAQQLDAHIAHYSKGKAGRKSVLYSVIKDADTKTVAFVALRKLLDLLADHDQTVTAAALDIGRSIEFELKMESLKKDDRKRYNLTHRHLEKNQHAGHRRKVFTYAFGKSTSVTFKPLSHGEVIHVGVALLETIQKTLGLFEKKLISQGDKNFTYYIKPTENLLKWIDSHKEVASLLNPDYLPMLVPPKPWISTHEGGYYSDEIPCHHIMKTTDKEHLEVLRERMEQGNMGEVIKSLNALQDTAWKINTKVLEVVKHLWENTPCDVADLPSKEKHRLPLCPVCGQDLTDHPKGLEHSCFATMSKEDVDEWKAQAWRIHSLNGRLISKQMEVLKMLSLACRFAKEESIYFPYQMDFRGRLYAIPAHLTPQGSGLAKGLLTFAKGIVLGNEKAVKWLAIHGANTYGNDKVSFEDRVQWVKENEERILATAQDPYSNTWWHDADKPFCFLAFCFEWAGYKEQGLAFESSLPIAMDGTCNGLQLYSLLLKDEVGGFAVNLTPTDTPQDLYGIVADKVKERIKADSQRSVAESFVYMKKDSNKVLYNAAVCGKFFTKMCINRKTTKRQVMVLPYGGTFDSCKEYSKEWLEEVIHGSNIKLPKGYTLARLSNYLAKVIWDSIATTVTKAPEAMQYLQKMASVMNKQNKPLVWETPSGLPVKQRYLNTKLKRVETHLGEAIRLNLQEEIPDTLNKAKQKSSIAPNYIHSLDASALMHTVNLACDKGIDAFAMIHDSYGTHAAKTECLAKTLRESFVDMFNGSKNLLTQWQEDVLRNAEVDVNSLRSEDLPELPSMGKLDIEQLKHSQFFFA